MCYFQLNKWHVNTSFPSVAATVPTDQTLFKGIKLYYHKFISRIDFITQVDASVNDRLSNPIFAENTASLMIKIYTCTLGIG